MPPPNPMGAYFESLVSGFKLLRKAGRLQLIQNSVLSVAGRRQYCIRIKKIKFISHVGISDVVKNIISETTQEIAVKYGKSMNNYKPCILLLDMILNT